MQFIVMITPVLIDGIGAYTYLFFAALNASFFPIIFWLYPETSGRSLEEIDLIFAKGYLENMSYVKAAKELPMMEESEIARYNREYGMDDSDEESGSGGDYNEKKSSEKSGAGQEDMLPRGAPTA